MHCIVYKRPCGPRASLHAPLRRREESRPAHATPYPRHVPASVSPCVARRKAALRWRLRSSRATKLCVPRAFRLRVAVTGDSATAPSPATELAEGGSWETPSGASSSSAESARGGSRGTPAGAGAPGTGSTAPSAACRRACSRKAVMGDTGVPLTYVTCVTETALYEQNGVPARSRPGSHDAPRPARARSPRVAEPTAQQRTLEA